MQDSFALDQDEAGRPPAVAQDKDGPPAAAPDYLSVTKSTFFKKNISKSLNLKYNLNLNFEFPICA